MSLRLGCIWELGGICDRRLGLVVKSSIFQHFFDFEAPIIDVLPHFPPEGFSVWLRLIHHGVVLGKPLSYALGDKAGHVIKNACSSWSG